MAAYDKVAKDMDKLEADLARVGWSARAHCMFLCSFAWAG